MRQLRHLDAVSGDDVLDRSADRQLRPLNVGKAIAQAVHRGLHCVGDVRVRTRAVDMPTLVS